MKATLSKNLITFIVFLSSFLVVELNKCYAQPYSFYIGPSVGLHLDRYLVKNTRTENSFNLGVNGSILAPLSEGFAIDIGGGIWNATYSPNVTKENSTLLESQVSFVQAHMNFLFFMGDGKITKPYFMLGGEYNSLYKVKYTYSGVDDDSDNWEATQPMGIMGLGVIFSNGSPIAVNTNIGFRAGFTSPDYVKYVNQLFVNVGVCFRFAQTTVAPIRGLCPSF